MNTLDGLKTSNLDMIKMSNLDIKIKMLETLYNLADKGKIKSFNTFSKYVIAIKDDMPNLLEKITYKNAVDKITLAMTSFEVDDLYYAKESVDIYNRTMDWINIGNHLKYMINNKEYISENEK
jgi:hypothetical protein